MKRVKVGQGYFQSGAGRGLKKSPIVYLINGKYYAKDKAGWECDFKPLIGELSGYVRVNIVSHYGTFHQTSGTNIRGFKHLDHISEEEKPEFKKQKEYIGVDFDNVKNYALKELITSDRFTDYSKQSERESMKYKLDCLESYITICRQNINSFEVQDYLDQQEENEKYDECK